MINMKAWHISIPIIVSIGFGSFFFVHKNSFFFTQWFKENNEEEMQCLQEKQHALPKRMR